MITKLKWKNHPILGNLELSLTNALGKPYNTVILAGENGTGKTTILDTLSTFLNLGTFNAFEYIEYNIEDCIYHIYSQSESNASFGFQSIEKTWMIIQKNILIQIKTLIEITLITIYLIFGIMVLHIQKPDQDLTPKK